MPFYAAPGVYVEVPSGARTIGAVGTSIAGFVGTAPDRSARPNRAVALTNWSGS
jgi:phage tail sheath protein FI